MNSEVFSNWESFQILLEANMHTLNTLTNDFVSLMDLPELNQKWYQETNDKNYQEFRQLRADKIFRGNKKRFFNPCEVLHGHTIFDNYSIQNQDNKNSLRNTQTDKNEDLEDKRDLNNILKLFEKFHEQ